MLKALMKQQAELAKSLREMRSVSSIWGVGDSHNSSHSSSQSQRFRDRLIDFWECAETVPQQQRQQQQQQGGSAQTSIWQRSSSPSQSRPRSIPSSALIKCQLTQSFFHSSEVTATRLFPKRHADILHTTLGLDADKIDSQRNGLLVCRSIKSAFNRRRVCFIYNALDGRFYFRVLDAKLRDVRAVPSTLTFAQLDGRPLCLPAGKLPYRRVLALHAREAIAHAKKEYQFETSEEDARAMQEALQLSDRVSRDSDERERYEESVDESVVGYAAEDNITHHHLLHSAS